MIHAKPFFQTGVMCRPDGKRMSRYAYPSSVAVLPDGRLFCCFYGCTVEGPSYSGCYGCFSEDDGQHWSAPHLLMGQDGMHVFADPNIVLHQGRLMIFITSYRCQQNVHDLSRSWTWKIVSEDSGRTWSPPVEVPLPHKYVAGKVHAGITLPDKTIIMGYSWDRIAEAGNKVNEEGGQECCAGVLRSSDAGNTWTPGQDLRVHAENKNGAVNGADEPALARLGDDSLFALLRTPTDHLWESRSRDGGRTWDPPQPSPFGSHNCPAELLRLKGQPETILVCYDDHPSKRSPLCVAYSTDGCHTWSAPKTISHIPDDWHAAAYPVACETPKGTIVVVWYQCKGDNHSTPDELHHICYARFNREWLISSAT